MAGTEDSSNQLTVSGKASGQLLPSEAALGSRGTPKVIELTRNEGLRQQLSEHFADPSLMDPRVNVSIADYVLSRRLEMAEAKESSQMMNILVNKARSLFQEVRGAKHAIEAGADDSALDKLAVAVAMSEDLLEAVEDRDRYHRSLKDLSDENRQAAEIKGQAAKINFSEASIAGRQAASALAGEVLTVILECFDKFVDDKHQRETMSAFIVSETTKILRRKN